MNRSLLLQGLAEPIEVQYLGSGYKHSHRDMRGRVWDLEAYAYIWLGPGDVLSAAGEPGRVTPAGGNRASPPDIDREPRVGIRLGLRGARLHRLALS